MKERREHEKVERSVLPRADPVQKSLPARNLRARSRGDHCYVLGRAAPGGRVTGVVPPVRVFHENPPRRAFRHHCEGRGVFSRDCWTGPRNRRRNGWTRGQLRLACISQPRKSPVRAKRTVARGQTGTINDQAECGHLQPLTPSRCNAVNGRSQGGAATARGRRRGDGISIADVQGSATPASMKSRSNGRSQANRIVAIDPLLAVAREAGVRGHH